MTLSSGFFGKVPNRGDFIRDGLPPAFITGLDGWWQKVLPESRQLLGEAWVDAWMEAPVWRFALAPGCCGPSAAVGVWLPSTDKAGRLFPLTLALVGGRGWHDIARSTGFLDAAEAIGFEAIETDVDPGAMAARLDDLTQQRGAALEAPVAGGGIWWTEGSPLVAPATLRLNAMPDGKDFAAMLRDAAPGPA